MLAQLPETDGLLVKMLLAETEDDLLLEAEIVQLSKVEGLLIKLLLADAEAEPATLALSIELLLGIELGDCSADGDGAALAVESCELVRVTYGLAESDRLLLTERVGVARAVPVFEAETDFVPVGDIVPVFEGARLVEGDPVFEGDALRLSKDADADTEGDIVGSIV